MNIEELFAQFDGAFAEQTLRAYRADYRVYSTWCQANGVSLVTPTSKDLAGFVDAMAAQKSSATVRRYIDSLATLRRMARLAPITQDPDVKLALKRMYRLKGHGQEQAIPLTRAVMEKLVAVCDDSILGLRDTVLLRLGYESMRRRAELCHFRFSDLEYRLDGRAAIRLRFSKADQMGKGKLLPLSPQLDALLGEWGATVGTTGYILRGKCGLYQGDTPFNPASINLRLRALQQRAGLNLGGWLSGHSFRVGAAVDLLEAGVSMEKIMLRGGWRSESSVIRYLRAWELD